MREITTISVKCETSSKFRTVKKRLGYHSSDALLNAIVNLINAKGWDKLDLECLERFGKIPEIVSGSAKSDLEMREKLGLKRYTQVYTQTDKISGKIKKKTKGKG
jgi:hypothetical protein